MKIDVNIDVWIDNGGVELYVNDSLKESYLLSEMVEEYISVNGVDMQAHNDETVENFNNMAHLFEECALMLRKASENNF